MKACVVFIMRMLDFLRQPKTDTLTKAIEEVIDEERLNWRSRHF